jgi:tRNA(Arg) A34 adenosine deaminase TadA
MLQEAAIVSRLKRDDRRFYIGAVGIRSDGTKVRACNGNPKEPTRQHHCEFRLSRKLDREATVYVARTCADGSLGLARPCPDCTKALRYSGVRKVYYTITDGEYGVLSL